MVKDLKEILEVVNKERSNVADVIRLRWSRVKRMSGRVCL